MPSRLSAVDLARLRTAGARPAGPPPAGPAPGPLAANSCVEVQRLVNAAGIITLANQVIQVGSPLAGQRARIRLDGQVMHVITQDGILWRTLPCPIPPGAIHQVHTSSGRTLANGDILRIEAIRPDRTLTVRLRGDRKPGGGHDWASGTFTYRDYQTAELAYATTAHAAQGQTTTVGLVLVAGTEDRPWLYSAMTRGAALNRAFVFTRPTEVPDPAPGTVPAPELARHQQLERERGGHQLIPARSARNLHAHDARAVLRDVLDRSADDESATTTLQRALADADHLAALHAIWEGETAGLRRERYRSCVAAALPPGRDPAELDTPQATWLWRTLRAAETAGHDITEVVRQAVRDRSLAGARDLPSVLDSRLRRAIGPATPAPPLPWSAQVPVCSGERQRYLTEIAAAMDDRKTRIGEFAAEHSPAWATAALGPVPDDPLNRLDWQTRAAHIGAYRELYGWDHDTEPACRSPPVTPRRKEPPGTPPGPPSPKPTSTTCPCYPTEHCTRCAPAMPPKQPGHHHTPRGNSARSGPPLSTCRPLSRGHWPRLTSPGSTEI